MLVFLPPRPFREEYCRRFQIAQLSLFDLWRAKRWRLSTFQRTSLARCLPLAAAARRPRAVPVFYPGEIEYLREQERRKIGIEIEDATWDKLRSLAAEYKIAGELGLT